MTNFIEWRKCRARDYPPVKEASTHIWEVANQAAALVTSPAGSPPPPVSITILDKPAPDVISASWSDPRPNPDGRLNGTYEYAIVPVDTVTGRVGDPIPVPPLVIEEGQEADLQVEFSSPPPPDLAFQVQRDGEWVGPLVAAFAVTLERMLQLEIPLGIYQMSPRPGYFQYNGLSPTLGLGPPIMPMDSLWFNDGMGVSLFPIRSSGLLPPVSVAPLQTPLIPGVTMIPGVLTDVAISPVEPPVPVPIGSPIGFFANLGGPTLFPGIPGPGTPTKLTFAASFPLVWFFTEFGQFSFSMANAASVSTPTVRKIEEFLPDTGYSQDFADVLNTIKEQSETKTPVRELSRTTRGHFVKPTGAVNPYLINDLCEVPVPLPPIRDAISSAFDGEEEDAIKVLKSVAEDAVVVAVFDYQEVVLSPPKCPPGSEGTIVGRHRFSRYANRTSPLKDGEVARVFWKNSTARFDPQSTHKLRLAGLDEEERVAAITLSPAGRVERAIDFSLPASSTPSTTSLPFVVPAPTTTITAPEAVAALSSNGLSDLAILDLVHDEIVEEIDVVSSITYDKVSEFLSRVGTSISRTGEMGLRETVVPPLNLLAHVGDIRSAFGACLPEADDVIPEELAPLFLLIDAAIAAVDSALKKLSQKWNSPEVIAAIDLLTYMDNLVFDFEVFRCQFGASPNPLGLEARADLILEIEASLATLEGFFNLFSLSLSTMSTATCLPLSVLSDILGRDGGEFSVEFSEGFVALRCAVGDLPGVEIEGLPIEVRARLECALEALSSINELFISARKSLSAVASLASALTTTTGNAFKLSAAGCSGPDVAALAKMVAGSLSASLGS